MKKTVFALLMILCFTVSGFASATRPEIRYVDFKVYDPVYVGVDKGFFVRHGVDVKITGSLLGGPTAIQAVGAGSAEAGLASVMALINANAAGLPVEGVTDIQSALKKQPLEEYYVRKGSEIKTVSNLKGKRFAVNLWKSSFHYTAMLALEKAGLQQSDVNFVLLPFDRQVQALEAGQVDVIGLMEPYAGYARSRGNVKRLFTANDVFGSRQFCLHFISRTWASAHPAEAQAFVAGIVDSENWIEKHQKEARSIIARYTGIDVKYVPDYYFQTNGAVIMPDVQFWISELERRGDLKKAGMKASDVATNEYNRAVQ